MAFDKELAILHGCFQFKSFQKNYPSRKKPHWGQKFLFFFFFFFLRVEENQLYFSKLHDFLFYSLAELILLIAKQRISFSDINTDIG